MNCGCSRCHRYFPEDALLKYTTFSIWAKGPICPDCAVSFYGKDKYYRKLQKIKPNILDKKKFNYFLNYKF